ncbi:hypothetical protein [Paenibacillus elgii]|uniref:hypothetical protein n=1 Tax=Paenibacillus elgii TaxID=189691 RepID=UPI0011B1CCF5|nr:hypothetical protein [Paenibacillus elgii]
MERMFKSMKGSITLVSEEKIDGFRIMSGIQKHFIHRAESESLLEFDCGDDRYAITGGAQRRCIPEQSEFCRHRNN